MERRFDAPLLSMRPTVRIESGGARLWGPSRISPFASVISVPTNPAAFNAARPCLFSRFRSLHMRQPLYPRAAGPQGQALRARHGAALTVQPPPLGSWPAVMSSSTETTKEPSMYTIITATVCEIRDRYFPDAEPNPVDFATTISVSTDYGISVDELDEALLGWTAKRLSRPRSIAWLNPSRLGIVVYASQEFFLFGFPDLDSYQEGYRRIQQMF